MRARRMLAAAALVAAAVTSTACSAPPGAAAVVDGRRIDADAVSVATDQLRDLLQGPTGATLPEPTVLQLLIDAPFFIDAAEEAGVGISAEEARSEMDANLRAREIEPPDWSPESIDVARYVLVLSALGGLDDEGEARAGAEAAARAADVRVNPRYGERDATTGFIEDATPAWLVDGATAGAAAGS